MITIVDIARRALPLMNPAARAEAVRLLDELTPAQTANSANADWRQTCAQAWEEDMRGVRTAIAAALHDGGNAALAHLRKMLPFLMREANRAPALGAALARTMAAAIADPALLVRTANAVSFDEEPGVTSALGQWRSREVFETDLGSADLRGLSRELLNRSIFSARATNADFLNEVAAAVDDILKGRTFIPQGRWRLLRKLRELGYDPATGFPQDMANVPPAERGSLQDLSSERRLDLILETNVRMASNYAKHLAGNTPYALHAYPAWELVRFFQRQVPRGTPDSHSTGWLRRWNDAAAAVNGGGVSKIRLWRKDMIARKDSPIWQALGDGAGGYTDTLGNPYPPFAFRSGMAWKPVARDRCVKLGLVSGNESPRRTEAQLSPGEKEVRREYEKLSPDLRAELERELNTDAEREFLDRTQAAHEAGQKAVAAERIARAPQVQAEHRARMAELSQQTGARQPGALESAIQNPERAKAVVDFIGKTLATQRTSAITYDKALLAVLASEPKLFGAMFDSSMPGQPTQIQILERAKLEAAVRDPEQAKLLAEFIGKVLAVQNAREINKLSHGHPTTKKETI